LFKSDARWARRRFSLGTGLTDAGYWVVLGADGVDRVAPVVGKRKSWGALGAIAVGVLDAVGIDSKGGQNALAGLENVARNAALAST
jgi:hypothetical protein